MKLTIYRIFSFLLLPIAILFFIIFFLFLRAAFSNPAMLFPLFLLACIVIYTFLSMYFLISGIDGKKFLGRSSKDWLKVNAIVSILFALLMISQCVLLLIRPEILSEIVAQARENAGPEYNIDATSFENYLRITSYFLLAYALVLFAHIIMSFQYIKEYAYLFNDKKYGQNNSEIK